MEIYLISPPRSDFVDRLDSVLSIGVDWFQYRRPNRNDDERYAELMDVKSVTDQHNTRLIVNDRPDLALAVDADAVHLGNEDLPVKAVKSAWPELTVGRTQRADASPHNGADYLSVGPVFPTSTKSVGSEPCGWESVESFLNRTKKPVYAIGGITPDRLKNIPNQLTGIAVISAVWNQDNPVEALKKLSDQLNS